MVLVTSGLVTCVFGDFWFWRLLVLVTCGFGDYVLETSGFGDCVLVTVTVSSRFLPRLFCSSVIVGLVVCGIPLFVSVKWLMAPFQLLCAVGVGVVGVGVGVIGVGVAGDTDPTVAVEAGMRPVLRSCDFHAKLSIGDGDDGFSI